MFNLSALLSMATQALAKRVVGSDSMFNQYKNFCSQLGMSEPSRAEFDQFVDMFNNSSQEDKMRQLQSLSGEQITTIMSKVGLPGNSKL